MAYSDLADQNVGPLSLHIQKGMVHYNEVNDKIFNIGIDMNMWDLGRNSMESISFHLFQ
jgi:hypothetical protein